jgi:hypothetical protein
LEKFPLDGLQRLDDRLVTQIPIGCARRDTHSLGRHVDR